MFLGNSLFNEYTEKSHHNTAAINTMNKIGAKDIKEEPTVNDNINHCKAALLALPKRSPAISATPFPLVFSSGSKFMKTISLVGSKKANLVILVNILCAAPSIIAK